MIFLRYLRFWLQSGNAHSIHSPFVFQLYTQVIRNTQPYYCFEHIEDSRTELLASTQSVQVTDFGAGSRVLNQRSRAIRDIARYSEKSPALAQLLFRLVNHFQPKIIFDLGTSLGTTTLYLCHANRKAAMYTFEGDPNLATLARQRFDRFGCTTITQVVGNIDQTLATTLEGVPLVDFVFFDANHRKQPTLQYFEQCLHKKHEQSVFVFDDIYWSAEMQEAWQIICAHPEVSISMDLFHVGIVFFHTRQPKQHFRLRL